MMQSDSCFSDGLVQPPTLCHQGHFLPIREDIPPRLETSKDWVKLGCCGSIDIYIYTVYIYIFEKPKNNHLFMDGSVVKHVNHGMIWSHPAENNH